MTSFNTIGKFVTFGVAVCGFGALLCKKLQKDGSIDTALRILSTSTLSPSRSLNRVVTVIGSAIELRRAAKYDEAIAKVEAILKQNSGNKEIIAWANVEKGISLIQKGEFALAEKALEEAKALKKFDTTGELACSIPYELSKVYARTGKVARAIPLIKEAISNVPENDKKEKRKAQMQSRQGEYYNLDKQYHPAKKILEKVLAEQIALYGNETDGEILITRQNLARAHLGLNEIAEAGLIVQTMTKIYPWQENGAILYLVGRLLEAKGDKAAKDLYRRALEIENKKRPKGSIAAEIRDVAKIILV